MSKEKMNEKMKQIEVIKVLSSMVSARLSDYENDWKEEEQWRRENPSKPSYRYWKANEVKPTEINRLMLVLRQEMIKLEKML